MVKIVKKSLFHSHFSYLVRYQPDRIRPDIQFQVNWLSVRQHRTTANIFDILLLLINCPACLGNFTLIPFTSKNWGAKKKNRTKSNGNERKKINRRQNMSQEKMIQIGQTINILQLFLQNDSYLFLTTLYSQFFCEDNKKFFKMTIFVNFRERMASVLQQNVMSHMEQEPQLPSPN